jgi:hypothetical protein
MKAVFVSIFILGFSIISKAQSYGIINDKDGFVNIRESKKADSRIVGKLYNDSPFSYEEDDKADWIRVLEGSSETENFVGGYIHKSRIFPLSKLKSIKNRRFFKDSCVAINDSLTVILKCEKFNQKKHKLFYRRPLKGENFASELTG